MGKAVRSTFPSTQKGPEQRPCAARGGGEKQQASPCPPLFLGQRGEKRKTFKSHLHRLNVRTRSGAGTRPVLRARGQRGPNSWSQAGLGAAEPPPRPPPGPAAPRGHRGRARGRGRRALPPQPGPTAPSRRSRPVSPQRHRPSPRRGPALLRGSPGPSARTVPAARRGARETRGRLPPVAPSARPPRVAPGGAPEPPRPAGTCRGRPLTARPPAAHRQYGGGTRLGRRRRDQSEARRNRNPRRLLARDVRRGRGAHAGRRGAVPGLWEL